MLWPVFLGGYIVIAGSVDDSFLGAVGKTEEISCDTMIGRSRMTTRSGKVSCSLSL